VLAFQVRYQRAAKPFKWDLTRRDLHVSSPNSGNGASYRKVPGSQYVTVITNLGIGTVLNNRVAPTIKARDEKL